ANGSVNNNISIDPYNSGAAFPSLDCRFTDFDGTSAGGFHLYMDGSGRTLGSLVLRDCQLNSAWVGLGGPNNVTLTLYNNLFERVGSTFLYHPTLLCYNNLFK